MTNTLESRFADAGARQIHYHVTGQGPAVMLLHGGGPGAAGYSNYRRNIEILSQVFTVYVPDLPGYGQSTKGLNMADPFGDIAQGLAAFMDAIGLDKAHMVGNSLGGAAALRLALDHPAKVDRLVLMGPGGGQGLFTPTPTNALMQLLTYYHGDGPSQAKLKAFIQQLVFNPGEIGDDTIAERFETSAHPDILAAPPLRLAPEAINAPVLWRDPRLPGLKARTLILWGMDDRVNPVDGGFVFLKSIPGAEMHLFTGCGHWVQWEKAEAFNALVAEFLARG
ncbi:alpha/beta fold hydrolase [Caulobacter hibisci]|uniref:Alpha/beta fold hydrolase n=1 Tax=Caulobacter hibisci TaxID=2035993 RepID=A0ABS0SWZ4_9CAUL|nr:alpha/beta fold hydrolase [Caulobacter hibisci]MBI1684108.1 alpha/beta fold hydrolase [Caulobacter hibisci]